MYAEERKERRYIEGRRNRDAEVDITGRSGGKPVDCTALVERIPTCLPVGPSGYKVDLIQESDQRERKEDGNGKGARVGCGENA